jgi:gliding motility-associated-like protein
MKRFALYLLLLSFVNKGFSQGAPACPSITAGAIGSTTICSGQCATITTTLVTNYQTTSYTVGSIPYVPYPFTGAAWSVAMDDIWSSVENIGFDFCFFGTSFNQCLAGSNGQISFGNLANAGAYDGWPCTTALPSTTDMPGNVICVAFRDIDPVDGGNCYYQIGGTAPCRYAVISWVNVPLFDNTGTQPNSTFQCVLYESTNFIDVYIGNSFSYASWNSGNGIVGIQNAAATVAVCPPGRNLGTWTANNEAWRFTPTGPPQYTFNWSDPTGVISTAQTTTVCPTTTTTYTASMVITNCDGTTFTTTSTQQVVVTPGSTLTVNSPSICSGTSTTLTASGATTYSWTPPTGLNITTGSVVIANPTTTTVYSVTGNGGGGCSPTSTATVTIINNPTIAVTNATICAGTTTTLTASGSTSYTWNTGAVSSTITESPPSNTNYTVTGGIGTCTGTAVGTISVNAVPIVTVPSATICAGASTVLTASGATNYTWSPGTGLNTTLSANVTANPTSTQNYTVIGANTSGCADTITTSVTVNAVPILTVASNTPCVNQTLNLTCNPNGLIYNWTGPNSYTSTSQNPTIAGVIAADAGVYTVLVKDANNCTNTATINVIINSLPFVSASASPACLNQTINLFATGGYASYSWSGPGGYTSASQNPSIPNVTAAIAGQYVVTVTNANGCPNASSVLVTVYPLPTITITSPQSICISSTGTLTASGALNYIWSPPNGLNVVLGTPVLIIPTSITDYTYTVTGEDINGCISTATTSVLVNGLPTVSIMPNLNKGCIPQCVTYTANPANASNYSWSFGNGQTSNITTPTVAMCYTASGNYIATLSLTDINGCINTATASVIAYPIPVPEFAYTPNPATILAPNVQFINQSSGAIITSYNWSFGDNLATSILKNPTYTYPDTGTYYVTLIDTSVNGCTASIIQTVVIEPDFTLYVPNAFTPNGDGKNEFFMAQGDGILSFKMYVFDRWGNNVFTSSDINTGWDGRPNNKGSEIVQQDVYVWKIDVTNTFQQKKSYKGTVTLIK